MAPPAATVAARAAQDDPRAAVNFGERVPYVVVHGPPSAPTGFHFQTQMKQSIRYIKKYRI